MKSLVIFLSFTLSIIQCNEIFHGHPDPPEIYTIPYDNLQTTIVNNLQTTILNNPINLDMIDDTTVTTQDISKVVKPTKVKVERGSMILKSVLVQTVLALHLGDDAKIIFDLNTPTMLYRL